MHTFLANEKTTVGCVCLCCVLCVCVRSYRLQYPRTILYILFRRRLVIGSIKSIFQTTRRANKKQNASFSNLSFVSVLTAKYASHPESRTQDHSVDTVNKNSRQYYPRTTQESCSVVLPPASQLYYSTASSTCAMYNIQCA